MGRYVDWDLIPDLETLAADGHFVDVSIHSDGKWTISEVDPDYEQS